MRSTLTNSSRIFYKVSKGISNSRRQIAKDELQEKEELINVEEASFQDHIAKYDF